jgi:hypothetical protein
MKCLNAKCVNELPEGVRSTRKFCRDACRQEYYRQQHHQDAALTQEVEELRTTVKEQAQEIAQLCSQLDIEKRYLEDSTPRAFKAWLRKTQPSSPWRDRFLSDQLVPARGSRAMYEAHMRRLHCTKEEREDFVRLWKLMLLQA